MVAMEGHPTRIPVTSSPSPSAEHTGTTTTLPASIPVAATTVPAHPNDLATVSDPGVTAAIVPAGAAAPTQVELSALLHSKPLVGIIDTGFNAHNPHLDYSQFTLGHDYLEGDNNPLLEAGQGSEHGTQVLGVIEATQAHGVAGLHADTPFWLSRAIGSGHWSDALNEFVDHARDSGQDHAVVNLSFDLTQTNPDGTVSTRFAFTPQELAALQYAHDNHILIVAAAGNQAGAMSALGKASQQFDNLITVGATDGMARADYSSYGAGLDVIANGGTSAHPLLTTMGDGVGVFSGTSAAAAQVVGAVSLVWEANPDLSYRQVIDILEQTATDSNTPGWDAATGFGVLNLGAAVDLAKQTNSDLALKPTAALQTALAVPPTVLETWDASSGATSSERPASD